MQVQRLQTETGQPSWTVIDDSHAMIDPVDRYLAFLSASDHSPNTVRAYAHDLRDFFEFLCVRDRHWRSVTLEDLGRFIEWLRLPKGAAAGSRIVLMQHAMPRRSNSTINRKLSAVTSFYLFHERRGVEIAAGLSTWRVGYGGWKPLLAHLGEKPRQVRALTLRQIRRQPRELSGAECDAILDACERPRDRLLLSLLRYTGLRIGEALGLRHEDVDVAGSAVEVVPRDNSNGARAKSRHRAVPAPAKVIRAYCDYLTLEYGAVDSDYVFINLSGPTAGAAWRYATVQDLVLRLRLRSDVDFTLHEFRHTYATELLRRGVPAEVVQLLLGHASYTTTVNTYNHSRVSDARAHLVRIGWIEGDR